MGRSSVRWVKPALQARSQDSRERLLDSAEALIEGKGFAAVGVADIAQRAGFSVGGFYSRFRDKESLLHCLADRFVAEVRDTVSTGLAADPWEGASVAELASELIAFMVQVHRERGGILREMLVRAATSPEIGRLVEETSLHVIQRLTRLLRSRFDETSHPIPEDAVAFGYRLVLGVLKEAILFREPGAHGIPSSDERLTAELVRAFLGYLGVGADSLPARSDASRPTHP